MPNHSKLEHDLLSPAQLKLTQASRRPQVSALTDSQLLRLIEDLRRARDEAGAPGQDGARTARDLLDTALTRAGAERRRRGLPAGRSLSAAAKGAPRPALAPSASPRPTVARKPASRKPAKPRKSDLRTGSRRIAKPAKPQPAQPLAATPKTASDAERQPPAATDDGAPLDSDAEAKAARKAAKAARKALKQARKAAKKAEKAARKATEKAERLAARQERKAARKARKKAGDAETDSSGDTATKPDQGSD